MNLWLTCFLKLRELGLLIAKKGLSAPEIPWIGAVYCNSSSSSHFFLLIKNCSTTFELTVASFLSLKETIRRTNPWMFSLTVNENFLFFRFTVFNSRYSFYAFIIYVKILHLPSRHLLKILFKSLLLLSKFFKLLLLMNNTEFRHQTWIFLSKSQNLI